MNPLGCPSDGHIGVGVAGGEGVVVGEDHFFGAVVAEGRFVVAADDGEGVEDVGGVVAGEAVEVEVEGVEAGAQVAALFFVPDEGRAVRSRGRRRRGPCRGRCR